MTFHLTRPMQDVFHDFSPLTTRIIFTSAFTEV